MNIKKHITDISFIRVFGIIFLIVLLNACAEKFEDYNTDRSQIMDVGVKELAGLFSGAQIYGSHWLTTDNYNRMSRTTFNHYCGYMTVLELSHEQYQFSLSYQEDGFVGTFSNAMPSLQVIIDLTKDKGEFQNNYAIALVWKAFLLHQVTDIWGPIPYTDGGSGKDYTTYESQKDVYYLMFEDLKKAIDIMAASVAQNPSANAFGSGDMIYDGSVIEWLKFANTLRLRLAMRISNIDPDKAKEEAEAAAAGITMDSNSDDALLDITEWNDLGNGLSRVNDWYSTLMSSSMESFLKGYCDPRMEQYFDKTPTSTTDVAGIDPGLIANKGGFHGMANGFVTAIEMSYAQYYSRLNTTRWSGSTKLTYPISIMYSAETYFLKAEGAWRGWNMGGGTAKGFYEDGIRVSMTQWTNISNDSIQKYTESENTPIAPNDYLYYHDAASDIPVKFSSNQEKQFEQIITQKWLALFPISVEAYAEYRRTRYPKIYAKEHSVNANIDLSKGMIVTRFPFVNAEYNSQPEQIRAAIGLLGNGVTEDKENIPLWWDVNNNGDIAPKFSK